MNTRPSVGSGPAGEDHGQLVEEVVEVTGHEAGADILDRHLAQCRMEARPRPGHLVECRPASTPALDPDRHPRLELADGERSIAFDDRQPDIVRDDPPERLRPSRHVDDPLRFTQPVREHLREVGEELPRTPGRFGCVVEPLSKWPGPVAQRRSERGQAVVSGSEASIQIVHGPSVACGA